MLAVGGLFWAVDAPTWLGWFVYQEQFIAAALGFALFLAFTLHGNSRDGAVGRLGGVWQVGRNIVAALGLSAGAWLCVRYPTLQADVIANETEALVLAVILLALSLEACRRSAGTVLTLVFGFFFAWAIFGYLLPGMLATKQVTLTRLLPYLALDTSSMLGTSLMIAATTVLVFMFLVGSCKDAVARSSSPIYRPRCLVATVAVPEKWRWWPRHCSGPFRAAPWPM